MAEPFFRSDAQAKVRAKAIYGVDLEAPRMLVGRVVRSDVPRGRILNLDVSAAEAIPGVTVITAADLPVPRYGMVIKDQPPLASEKVRFSGEPLAAVAAPDQETLARAVAAVVIDIEPEAAVFDLEEAYGSDALLVHPELADYELNFDTEREGNVCGITKIEVGDVDAAFANAALVVEGSYSTPRVHQGYIEPRACLATVDDGGGFHVVTSTQNPFGVRGTLCAVLGMPESQVRVVASTVGGGFGGKLDVTLEHFACLLARKSGRPVKIVCSRAEELATANPRENSVVRIRSAIDSAGRIIGRDVVCLLDAGAYAHDTPFIGAVASVQGTGPYLIENARSEAVSVYTNTQPTGAYRGPSGPQMVLAIEAHMDEIALKLGMDRAELRRRHFFRDGDVALNGQVLERPSAQQCLDRALAAIDYDAPRPPGRAVGFACAWWTTTAGAAAATVRLEGDGTIAVITGGTEIGSGALASGVVSLTARAMGVEENQVRLASTADTATGAYDFGAQGSRTTFNVGNAVLGACDEVRDQIFDEAAHLLEAAAGDLELGEGAVNVRGVEGMSVTLRDVAGAALGRNGPIHASSRYVAPPTPYDVSCVGAQHFYPTFNSPSFHCHAVEVEVDPDTGHVEILKYVVAQDVGKAIVPPAIEGQIQGGVLQGIGMALFEEELLRNGVVTNTGFDSYKLPTVMESTTVECILVEEPSADGPGGARGVGEPPVILPAAALANAVAAATGAPMNHLPMTPELVLQHLADVDKSRNEGVNQ
jgi:CO/xanthine dehydrogenase Mo-binding subunit